VIDAWGRGPMVIFGSANWTDAALVSESGNDENIVFLPHRDIARMFYAQFKRMTGLWRDRDDCWFDIGRTGSMSQLSLWMTDTNQFVLDASMDLQAGAGWSPWIEHVTGVIGRLSYTINGTAPALYFRARKSW